MPIHSNRLHNKEPLTLVCTAMLMMTPFAIAQTSQPASAPKLIVAGNDSVLWLVVGQQDNEQRTVFYRFAFQDKTSAKILPVTGIRQQQGHIERWAVVGKNLHVFFGSDENFPEIGAHYRYERSMRQLEWGGVRREIPLPGPVLPQAVASESTGNLSRLWAVVSAETAAQVHTEWNLSQTTQPEESDEESDTDSNDETTPKPSPVNLDELGSAHYHLVSYDGFAWQTEFPATVNCHESQRVWLTIGNDRFYLLWQDDGTTPLVHCAWTQKDRTDQWVHSPSISLGRQLTDGFASVINRELVFAALIPDESSPKRLRCCAWVCRTNTNGTSNWQQSPEMLSTPDLSDEELSLAVGSAVGGCFDKLAVLRPTDTGAEIAFFSPSLGGTPDEPFQEVPLSKLTPSVVAQRNLRDLAAMLVVAALVTLVFWHRQESITTPVILPVGLRVVGLSKRALITLIDMLPAAAIVLAIWFQPISEFSQEFRVFLRDFVAAAKAGQTQTVEALHWPASIVWAWMWFRLIYVAYCIGFEIFWQATPGKRLLHCAVALETLEKPATVHIIIRNITKLIELEPYLQIWPFMLVIILMRNTQRVGDLLAKTIVVERHE